MGESHHVYITVSLHRSRASNIYASSTGYHKALGHDMASRKDKYGDKH